MPEEINKSDELKLSDLDKIRTRFCFLDESGNLNDATAPFFTIGVLKCSQPYFVSSRIIYKRQANNFHDELKFNKLSKNNLPFAKEVIKTFFDTRSLYFYSYTLDKQGSYFNREFGGDPWKAYEDISIRLLKSSCVPKDILTEILIVIADYVTTPPDVRFEVNVKRRINEEFHRLAIAGVARFDSRSNDLLQIVDLIIGAINYDLKLSTGLVKSGDRHKRQFVEFLRENIGASNFLQGFRSHMFNIFVDKDIRQRLPFASKDGDSINEKGPSS